MNFATICFLLAAVVTEDATVESSFLKLVVTPNDGAVITELTHKGVVGDHSGPYGLLLDGFGVGSPYVPQLRLNEVLETDESSGRPSLRYTYDCQGANIKGFRVTRVVEPLHDEASVRVRWRIENKGDERQWLVPWVRNDVAPGGKYNEEDRVDVPTFSGVRDIRRAGYYPAARNWVASTDPIEQVTVYGVFNAEQTHSFLTLRDEQRPSAGFHTAFVPKLLNPGAAWETTYRINIVRGLRRVDFASSELAGQIEYRNGKLEVLLSSAKVMRGMEIHASIVAPNGRRWKLDPKKFSIDPNHLVRCTFDWTAPADSAYEFLAELRQGGKQFVLSEEMSTPHGGIDTTFVVRNPSEAPRMVAWTDAANAIDRGPRTLKRALAAAAPADVWVESSLEKIHPTDAVEPTGPMDRRVRVSLAGNERESFQVVVKPPSGRTLRGVDFKKGPLINRAANAILPASRIQISSVTFHPVVVPSFYEGPTGQWPDALPGFEPFDAEGGKAWPVWFTVYAPAGTAPGTYKGKLIMTAEDAQPVDLDLEVTVYGFDLPVTPALRTDFGFDLDEATAAATARGSRLSKAQVAEAYALNALAHRVTLRDYAQLPEPGEGDYAARLAGFLPRLKYLLERGVNTVSAPASLVKDPAALKAANRFVKSNGLEDVIFCHIAHEPPPPAWPALVETMKQWVDAAPDIPIMITNEGLQPFLPEGVEIWGVHVQLMDTLNNKTVLDHIKEGKRSWWYLNHRPPRPYCNFLVDFAAMDHRMLFWQSWALGMDGLHYWSINYASGEDPYQTLADVTPVNGDGRLVYPAANGPVNSIRWENIRDGIEDYDYLAILTERWREARKSNPSHPALERAAQALNIKGLVPDLVSFPRDPEQLAQKRDEIARAIVALGEAAAGR